MEDLVLIQVNAILKDASVVSARVMIIMETVIHMQIVMLVIIATWPLNGLFHQLALN
jgi:hypothetical protein